MMKERPVSDFSSRVSLNLPFYLAASSSPCGQYIAQVVIGWSMQNKMETQCFISHSVKNAQEKNINLWSSATLIPTANGTLMAWQNNGKRLAVSQFLSVYVSDLAGNSWIYKFRKPVTSIIYDNEDTLLILAGDTLYSYDAQNPYYDRVNEECDVVISHSIYAVEIVNGVTYIAQRYLDMIFVITNGGTEVFRYSVSDRDIDKVSLQGTDDNTIFLALCDRPVKGSCRFTVVRLYDECLFIDCEVGVGIAELKIDWHVLDNRSLAFFGELDETVCALWLVDETRYFKRLTSLELEVDMARWSPDNMTVIVSGKDISRLGARRSLCLGRDGYLYWDRQVATSDAIWINDNEYLWVYDSQETSPRWLQVRETLPSISESHINTVQPVFSVSSTALPKPLLLAGENKTAGFGILYIMGPHRFFAYGPQRLFYHYSIRSQLEAIEPKRGLVFGLNGTGALGGGRSKRMSTQVYEDAALDDIKTGVEYMREYCNGPIILVAASLGCLPALRFLAESTIDGAVFLNPVYSADIPKLQPWRYLYETNNGAAQNKYAPLINTPLLLVHGQRDPISPSLHSSDFVMSLPEDLYFEYVTVPNEGHIFQSNEGWRTLLDSMHTFIETIINQPYGTN